MLDYFQGPAQRRYEKIFSWEEFFDLKPETNFVKFVRLLARESAMDINRPALLLVDNIGNPNVTFSQVVRAALLVAPLFLALAILLLELTVFALHFSDQKLS